MGGGAYPEHVSWIQALMPKHYIKDAHTRPIVRTAEKISKKAFFEIRLDGDERGVVIVAAGEQSQPHLDEHLVDVVARPDTVGTGNEPGRTRSGRKLRWKSDGKISNISNVIQQPHHVKGKPHDLTHESYGRYIYIYIYIYISIILIYIN